MQSIHISDKGIYVFYEYISNVSDYKRIYSGFSDFLLSNSTFPIDNVYLYRITNHATHVALITTLGFYRPLSTGPP